MTITRNGVIRSCAARLGWVPAFGELLDDLRAERGQVMWIAAGHQPLIGHYFLVVTSEPRCK
jgi:hypothetical protein